jgi:hypothetical protein
MHGNLASIMPTVIATWCEQAGHNVSYTCFTGFEDLRKELPEKADLIFIGAFTQAAYLAYALSNLFRSKGAVTVLGGPHARCYPDDAINYFDYVMGFTDKKLILDLLQDFEPSRVQGKFLTAATQPVSLPSITERWKFIEPTIKKAPFMKIIPMIGSMGCPYTCTFCIDSSIQYQVMDLDSLKEDIRFVKTKFKRPIIAWHDPNFGIKFNEIMETIESTGPLGSVRHIAETSMSMLNKKNLQRLQKNGFVALLPGVESWFEMGYKTRTGSKSGQEKLDKVSEHMRLIQEYIPYLQVNFVLGLDSDAGNEPFELTKKFIDNVPAVLPGYSLLTAFGEAAPVNLEYQRDERIIPFPFHFLNNHLAMNVKPKNYSWLEFYDHIIDLTAYSVSWNAIRRRLFSNSKFTAQWLNFVRAISSEGFGRVRFFKEVRSRLKSDSHFRDFFEGESSHLPAFYVDIIRKDLGYAWNWLPDNVMKYDHLAYLRKNMNREKPESPKPSLAPVSVE